MFLARAPLGILLFFLVILGRPRILCVYGVVLETILDGQKLMAIVSEIRATFVSLIELTIKYSIFGQFSLFACTVDIV